MIKFYADAAACCSSSIRPTLAAAASNRAAKRLLLGQRPASASIVSNSATTAPEPNLLHYEWIAPRRPTDAAAAPRPTSPTPSSSSTTIVFLHGLLGSGRNIKTMARQLCAQQRANGLLLDITGHGRSPHNRRAGFADAVADIEFTVQRALAKHEMEDTIISDGEPSSSVSLVGHSLGGRLSLHFASQGMRSSASLSFWRPKSVWLLDTVPGMPDASVVGVLQSARAVLREASSSSIELTRNDVVECLRRDGHAETICQWLAAQYDVQSQTFAFDVDTAASLVRDFERHDFWEQLESLHQRGADGVRGAPAPTPSVHLVQAGRNPAWKSSLPDVQDSVAKNRLQHYVLPNAGHWVHVDNLPGLLDIFGSVDDW